jgi:hypothetical protein
MMLELKSVSALMAAEAVIMPSSRPWISIGGQTSDVACTWPLETTTAIAVVAPRKPARDAIAAHEARWT